MFCITPVRSSNTKNTFSTATGVSPRPAGKTKVIRKRTTSQRSGGSENRMIATLRSEVDELKHENEDLKRRMEVCGVRNIMYR